MILAEARQRGHRRRHREAHQEGGREDQREAADQPQRVGQRADQVEHAVEEQAVADQQYADGDEDLRHHAPRAIEEAFREERAQPGEHQHAGDQHRGRDDGVAERQHELGDHSDLDHDVADPQAREIEDGAELAARARKHDPPAEDHRQQHQRCGGDAGDAERCPEEEIAPLVLQQLELVGDAPEVGGLHVGREIGALVGQRAAVEDIAVGDLVPAAMHQVVPGQLAHGGCRHGGAGLVGRRLRIAGGCVGAGVARHRLVLRLAVGCAIGEDLSPVIGEDLVGLRRIVLEAGIIDLVERHGARVIAQLLDLLRREAAALVEHGRGREIARDHEEAVGDVALVGLARRCCHGGVELQHRFRRLFLVPERHREHAAVLEGAHVARHRLARVGELLHDGEAARARQAGGIGEAQVDHVVTVGRIGEIEPAVVVDHLDLGIVQHVVGEVAQALVAAEGAEHGGIAFGHRDALGVHAQGDRSRDAAAELHDERVGRALDQVRIDHRQEAEIGGLARRQVADDAARTFAVDVHAEIGVVGHLRQRERRVVGEPGREVEVRARIDLEVAERRRALVDARAVGEFACVSHALVVGHGELRDVQERRQREVRRDRRGHGGQEPAHAAPAGDRREPHQAADEP